MATTMKEIAQLAGVSIGTVDRALHNRGRVKPDVAQRIRKIAEELEYRPNSIAQGLFARSRSYRIAVIFHRKNIDTFFEDILQGIEICKEEVSELGVTLDLFYGEDFSLDSQLKLLEQVEKDHYNALIIVPINHDSVKARINGLYKQGIPVILLSNIIDNCDFLSFVGCDYTRSGQIVAGFINMIHPGPGKLLYLSPPFQMMGHVMRARGLQERLATEYPHIQLSEICELHGSDVADYKLTKDVLARYPDTNLIVCPGAGSSGYMEAIEEFPGIAKSKIVSYDYSENTDRYIRNKIITATLVQHPKRQGYLAVKTAIGQLMDPQNFTVEKYQYLPTKLFFLENLADINHWSI